MVVIKEVVEVVFEVVVVVGEVVGEEVLAGIVNPRLHLRLL